MGRPEFPPRPLAAIAIALLLAIAPACQSPGLARSGTCPPARRPYVVGRPPLPVSPPRTPVILGNYAGYNYPLNPRVLRQPRPAPANVDPAAAFD